VFDQIGFSHLDRGPGAGGSLGRLARRN
jgi:hypothetical protein